MSATNPASDGTPGGALGGAVKRLAEIITGFPGELVASFAGWIWEVDERLVYTYASNKGVELLGRPLDQVIGRTPFDFMPLDEATRARAVFARLLAAREPFTAEILRYQRPGGAVAVVETSGTPLFRADGSLRGLRCTDRDIQPSGRSLDGRLAQLEAIYATTPVALCLIDRQGRMLAANEPLAALCGLPVANVVHAAVRTCIPPMAAVLDEDLVRFEQGVAECSHEFAWRDGVHLCRTRPVRDRRGQVTGVTVAITDITERKRMEQQLAEANRRLKTFAAHDHLTGLPNRRFFDSAVLTELRRGQREGHGVALALFDVDHFKRYNDRYGHPAGDSCLQSVARAAEAAATRAGDVVCRYGGEEFAVLMPCIAPEEALAAARRVCEAVAEQHVPHADSAFGRVTVSVGVAWMPPVQETQQLTSTRAALLAQADKALYAAKAGGRNQVRMHD